ncbi:MAG: GNAT family N-acetyltransferase [Dehalococcoidales bacterium]|nr:GNAT family N-acetyltransferase [Dehalococcoidales bacterium]
MNSNAPEKLSFRRMILSDIESVLALGKSNLTYGDLASADPDGPLAMSFVADNGKKLVGFVLARAHFVGIPITKVCVIHAITVDSEYQRKGVGTQLLSELQTKCEEEDIQIMRMLVPQHDINLRNYMEALGFRHSNFINFDKLCGGEG